MYVVKIIILSVSFHYAFSMRGGNLSKSQCFYHICVVGSYYVLKRANHIRSLEVKIHQFTFISTNTHIPVQENGNAVPAYCAHAAVDACRIAVCFLNVRQNCIMCPV